MDIKAKYLEIEVEKIAADDTTYLLTPTDPVQHTNQQTHSLTTETIVRRILLKPPLLCPEDDSFLVVCGHDIFKDYVRTGLNKTCRCLVITEKTDPLEILSLALEDIASRRKVSPAEEAICLGKGVQATGRENALAFFTRKLSLTQRYAPDTLLKILEFNDEQITALHNGKLELATAFDLLTMNESDRIIFYNFITELKLSTANQRKLVKNCRELGKRQNIHCGDVLRAEDFSRIFQDTGIDLPRKTAQIFTLLKQKLSPQLFDAERDFHNFLDQLDLPKNSTVEHSISFEQDQLTFKCIFKNRADLVGKLPELKDIFE